MHAPGMIAARHLLVNDPAARGHPLHVARGNRPVIAHAVAVFDRAGQDIGNRFDPAVWVPGKSGDVVLRNVVAEIVQEEKRVEIRGVAEPEGTAQMHARSVASRFGADQPPYRTNRHGKNSLSGSLLHFACKTKRGLSHANEGQLEAFSNSWPAASSVLPPAWPGRRARSWPRRLH